MTRCRGGTYATFAVLGRAQAGMATQQYIASLIPKLRGLRQPVIAAVNGAAAGGGLAANMRYYSQNAEPGF